MIISAGPKTKTMYGQFNLEGESKERGTLKGRNQEKEKANIKTLNLPYEYLGT